MSEKPGRIVEEGYQADPFPNEVLTQIANGTRHSKKITLSDCTNVEGKFHYRDKLFVPESPELHLELLQQHHDAPAT